MAFKYIAVFAFLAVAAAGVLDLGNSYGQQILIKQQPTLLKQVAYEAPAQYEFNYSVKDEHTGDIKEQQEKRSGDNVEGFYALIEPDGHRRIVHYSADEHNGFQARVEREYTGIQIPQPQQKIILKSAPIVQKVIAAPALSYSAPLNYNKYY